MDCSTKLKCKYCGKNLTDNIKTERCKSLVVLIENNKLEIIDVYTCCKGDCDKILARRYFSKNNLDKTIELYNFTNPFLYIRYCNNIINDFKNNIIWYKNAIENYQDILLAMHSFVMRESSEEEKEIFKKLSTFS